MATVFPAGTSRRKRPILRFTVLVFVALVIGAIAVAWVFRPAPFQNTRRDLGCGGINAIAFQKNGDLLAVGCGLTRDGRTRMNDGSIVLLDSDLAEIATLESPSKIRAIAFRPLADDILASGDDAGAIYYWDVKQRQVLLLAYPHTLRIRSIAFSPDGSLLASAGEDGRVIISRPLSRDILHEFQQPTGWEMSVVFSPDGKLIAAGSDEGKLNVWTMDSQFNARSAMTIPNSSITCLEFSPDSEWLLVGLKSGAVLVFDVSTDEITKRLNCSGTPIRSISFADSGLLAVVSSRISLFSWPSLATVAKWTVRRGGWPSCGALCPAGSKLATGCETGELRLWQLTGN